MKLLDSKQTIDGIGAGQGAVRIGDSIYLFGDAETGVLREYVPDTEARRLDWTGREVLLTLRGKDICSHPTGLAYREGMPTFLGDTVSGRGRIFVVDWEQMWADGTLDNAVLGVIEDDAAVNGTRPEYVRVGERWLVATSDYGPESNQLRLMDPDKLAAAANTTDDGVVLFAGPCGPFVQSIEWLDDHGLVVLVQNQTPGLGYRFTYLTIAETTAADGPVFDVHRKAVIDLPEPADELEGFCEFDGAVQISLSAMRNDNLRFFRICGLRPGDLDGCE